MFKWLGKFVDSNEKELKRLEPIVNRINELEPDFDKLTDTELKAKTAEFKARLEANTPFDELVPEAFAAVRESAKRTMGQRHFDVQLMGGIVLHQGKIAEMKTGEGKTLAATLPLYLNSLMGKGCHLVTVNDYLAKRDCRWMGPVYDALGVSVSSIYGRTLDNSAPSFIYDTSYESEDKQWSFLRPVSRKQAYAADITYGTNNEFGFDYLRDNMVIDLSQCVQRPLNYAIVDEVDNLLIDEARTPLIISGPAGESGQRYQLFARFVPQLREDEDYIVDEKHRSINLTDAGIVKMEQLLNRQGVLKSPNLYDPANYGLIRYLESALKAHALFRKDRDYVVRDGQVVIVDEFTGRLMLGRRYSEGLHQAIEAKEHVKVQQESMTFATITYQNYFRMYEKLAGMTGTALTEAEEFHKIYNLEAIAIPTNKPMVREDFPDQIYKDETAKFKAVVREVQQLYKNERPVLVGTVSIEKSELLSNMLKKKGVPHQVLNAKNHEKEASIIAQAGQPGAVMVATNMAGRGVDIVLGGKEPADGNGREKEDWLKKHNRMIGLGGLHVIGTERHEARRIDNQLRGRAGRQGDLGSTRFYVSLEDDVVRRFGGDRVKGIMEWAGMDENTPIENKFVARAIESSQVRVEGYHFDIRKHLVEYDDVINKQRELIYNERGKILSGADLKANILSMIKEEIQSIVATHISDDYAANENLEGLIAGISAIFLLPPEINVDSLSQMKPKQIEDKLIEFAESLYSEKEKELGPENTRTLERVVMLRTIDSLWIEHLTEMDHMRRGIGLQAFGRQDPLVAYKREGHNMFQNLLNTIQHDVVHTMYHVSIAKDEANQKSPMAVQATRGRASKVAQRPKVSGKKIGRNDPCPCGSGKKYKHCCGR